MKASTAAAAALTTVAGAAAALALNAGVPSASAGSSTPATNHAHVRHAQVVTLTLRYADADVHFVGKDANHPVIGDEFIDTVPIRSHGAVVGRARSVCTIVSGASEATFVTQCVGTYSLRRGDIVTTGAEGSSNSTTDAVTGGTGAYAYATGTARTVSGASAATVTIRYLTA